MGLVVLCPDLLSFRSAAERPRRFAGESREEKKLSQKNIYFSFRAVKCPHTCAGRYPAN